MAVSLLQAHALVPDPHGDRAYADDKFATQLDLTELSDSVNGLSTRVVGIETGSTPVSGINAVGPVTVSGANLTVIDTGVKGYRFRQDGGDLDLEATGAALFLSVWSGTAFDGTQRHYLRLESGAHISHGSGVWQFAPGPFDAAVHTIDGLNNRLGFHGATPVARQTVTGSRSDGTGLASLLTVLATLGLIVDETTT